MKKHVREAMTPAVRTAGPTQSLVEAARLMRTEDAGSIPVVEDNRLIGIVTDRDITVRGIAEGADPKTTTVAEVASQDVVTISPDQNLDEALSMMARYQVRRLPVVEDGNLVGILAQADIAMEAEEKQAGEMLVGISQPSSTPRE